VFGIVWDNSNRGFIYGVGFIMVRAAALLRAPSSASTHFRFCLPLRCCKCRPLSFCCVACAPQSTQNGGSTWVYETPNFLATAGDLANVVVGLANVPTTY
jgi:hypothetical protein